MLNIYMLNYFNTVDIMKHLLFIAFQSQLINVIYEKTLPEVI